MLKNSAAMLDDHWSVNTKEGGAQGSLGGSGRNISSRARVAALARESRLVMGNDFKSNLC